MLFHRHFLFFQAQHQYIFISDHLNSLHLESLNNHLTFYKSLKEESLKSGTGGKGETHELEHRLNFKDSIL